MTTVNLTALAEARSKMTREWTSDVWQNTNEGGWAAVGPHHKHEGACDEPGDPAHVKAMADAAGIVAEHNAIGVLIEVARTLLVSNAARADAARLTRAYNQAVLIPSPDRHPDDAWKAFDDADRARSMAKSAHDAALAKVSL